MSNINIPESILAFNSSINIAEGNSRITVYQQIYDNSLNIPKKYLSPLPIKNSCFIGRENDEKNIIDSLLSKHRVIINGIGGIGKTTLAKQIYFDIEKNYEYVIWINYHNNWIDSILNSLFTSYFHFEKSHTQNDKYNIIFQFLTNLEEKTLIVIDNFNSSDSGELSEIQKLPADILLTSRKNYTGIEHYDLDVLSTEDCVKLFKENYKYTNHLTYKDDASILEIIEKSQRYTLAIELISKSISYKAISISDFLEKLRNNHYQLKTLDLQANSDWNDTFRNEDIALQLSKVYSLSELSEREQSIAETISILPPFSKISLSDIERWKTFDCNEYLTLLENKGWIKRECETVYMHEIICNCIYQYNPITFKKCESLLNDLQNNLKVGPNIDTIKYVKYAEYTFNILKLKKSSRSFCRHLAVKEAALVFKEVGEYSLAKELLNTIIPNYDKENKNDVLILAELYNNYSKIFSMESNVPDAIKKSLEAENLIDSINDDNSKNFYFQKMVIKKTVGMHYAHLKNNELAFEKMTEAIECSKKIENSEIFQVANLYSDYSLLLFDMGKLEDSIKNYKLAIQIYDECSIVADSPWRNTTYTNFADTLILNNQPSEAIYYEYQSLLGKYRTYPKDNLAIANALLGMGHIYRREERLWDVAAIFYQKAATIYKKQNPICDGYCDSIAGLSIVTNQISLAVEAYEIVMNHPSKNYYYITYTDILCALREHPEEVITLGEKTLKEIKTLSETHIAEQYIYALIGEAYYKLKDNVNAQHYLQKASAKAINQLSTYYLETQKILEQLPSIL